MTQLSLKIISCLPYSADNFLLHEGVIEAFRDCFALAGGKVPTIIWVCGAPRSGKTHFTVKLCDELAHYTFFPNLIEGKDFSDFLESRGTRGPFSRDEIFVIDSAEEYFDNIADKSGAVVAFLELARQSSTPVVFVSSKMKSELICDEHVMSRLRAGHLLSLFPPADNDMPQLIKCMAHQRGILLTEKRVGYIAKRLKRDVPSIEEYLDRVTEISRSTNQSIKLPLLSEAL